MSKVYEWTDKRLPAPTRASGFDAGNGGSDAKRQLERLKAENAGLTKDFLSLKEEMRNLIESLKTDKKGKKGDKSANPDQTE